MTASAPQAIALARSPDRPIDAVGDDVHVAATGLVEVVPTGRGHVGDRARHRHRETEDRAGRVRGAAAEADQDPRRAGAHQVQRRLVGRAAADDHRHVELVDELLEVQRLGLAGDVLGGHRRAADDEHVDAGVDDRLGELLACAAGRALPATVTPASRISGAAR